MENNKCNGIIDILKLIDRLQRCVTEEDIIDNTCSRPFLGNITTSFYNTRPINLFTCDGNILTLSYYVNGTLNTTSVFRVEGVDDNFCTVRLLGVNTDGTYTNTGETAIINIDCICALKCLNDIILNL